MEKKHFIILASLILLVLIFGCTDSTGSVNGVPITTTNQPPVTTPSQSACEYTYTDWTPAVCPQNETQTRTQANSVANCTGTPILTQTCNYQAPTPQCASNEVLCSGVCSRIACRLASDCDDNIKGTVDECAYSDKPCVAVCAHTPVTTCADNDAVCPTGCNPLSDNDCQAYAMGTVASSEGLNLTISNPRISNCTYPSPEGSTYFVFHVDAKNTGTDKEFVSSMNFNVVDPNRKQYDGSIIPYPIDYGGRCENAQNTAFDSSSLLPGSTASGDIWIELKGNVSNVKGKWLIAYTVNTYTNDYLIYETQIN